MGIFGNDAQSQVDFDDLKARVIKLEQAVAVLQAQAGAAVPYGAQQAAPGATAAGTPVQGPSRPSISSAGAAAVDADAGAAVRWHNVEASMVCDPVSGEDVLLLVQTDVSSSINADLEVKKVCAWLGRPCMVTC